MDVRIDLDAAAQQIEQRRERWERSGITVGKISWREQADGWPPSFKTSRSDVRDADSIGIALSKGRQEGRVVLFSGGWTDFLYWSGDPADEPIVEAPGWEDWLTVDGFANVLDRLGVLLA